MSERPSPWTVFPCTTCAKPVNFINSMGKMCHECWHEQYMANRPKDA